MKHLTAIILALITFLSSTAATPSQEASRRPTLVIGVTVEGLDLDYLSMLRDYMGDRGFRRLFKEGVTITDLDFGPGIDPVAGTSIIYTGAAPSVTGISAERIYDPTTDNARFIFDDPQTIGNFTSERFSPKRLRTSTITDEVRIDGDETGVAYSVAVSSQQALATGSHTANGAFWISDIDGNWATTTYYPEVPVAVAQRNYRIPLRTRLDTLSWQPIMAVERYPGLPAYKRYVSFKHNFRNTDVNRYRSFKASPKGNTEVTDVAIDLITGQTLGRHTGMDMLNVAYTVAPWHYGKTGDNRLETLDAYLRLDHDLGRLIDAAEKHAGAGNVAVMVAGVPAKASSRRDDEKWKIPYGEFSVKRAVSLLNMYLMAIHGNGDWVSGVYGDNFWLNRKLIKDRDLDLAAMRAEAAEFLMRMSGIDLVYTIDDIIAGRAGDDPKALQRNTDLDQVGDLIVRVSPGWAVVDDDHHIDQVVNRYSHTSIPCFILSPHVGNGVIAASVDARAVAPTMSRVIGVRRPNGASLPPVHLP